MWIPNQSPRCRCCERDVNRCDSDHPSGGEAHSLTNRSSSVRNFADQAVIAIENARLLTELRHRTDELGRSVEELRALGEVSQAVNSTLDLETVLSTIVAKAAQLSGTEAGAIYVFDELQREFHLRATYGMEQELIDALTHQHIGLDEPNVEGSSRKANRSKC